ncbi:hypothetical protein DXT66_14020 [Nocardia farcinica]|nr:hypothetical protein DXT66_14020 [Nocardia farcinica]
MGGHSLFTGNRQPQVLDAKLLRFLLRITGRLLRLLNLGKLLSLRSVVGIRLRFQRLIICVLRLFTRQAIPDDVI